MRAGGGRRLLPACGRGSELGAVEVWIQAGGLGSWSGSMPAVQQRVLISGAPEVLAVMCRREMASRSYGSTLPCSC